MDDIFASIFRHRYHLDGDRLREVARWGARCVPALAISPGHQIHALLTLAIAETERHFGLIEWSDNPYTRDRMAIIRG